jgi:hypothetical protein
VNPDVLYTLAPDGLCHLFAVTDRVASGHPVSHRPEGGRLRCFAAYYRDAGHPELASQLESGFVFHSNDRVIAPAFLRNRASVYADDNRDFVSSEIETLWLTGCVGLYTDELARRVGLPQHCMPLHCDVTSNKKRLIFDSRLTNIK